MTYYTYKAEASKHLGPGDTLGFTAGQGYYVKPKPVAPPKPPAPTGPPPGMPRAWGPGGPGWEEQQGLVPGSALAPSPPPGTTGASAPDLAIDWRSWLTDWGFPSDVIANLDRMARQYTPAQADLFTRDAILYLRGTDWHKQTFVGFAEGYKSGLFQDEQQYRSYVQSANDLYNRYYGRNVTSAELGSAFTSGYDITRVGKELESAAYINANRGELQYLGGNFGEGQFSNSELDAYGDQQVGIGNALGQDLMRRVGMAQQRLKKIFDGTLATGPFAGPAMSAPSATTRPDVGR